MRKWMRERMKRRKKSSENTSESTGKIGQTKDPSLPAPIMPSYDSGDSSFGNADEDPELESDSAAYGDAAEIPDAPEPPSGGGKYVVETQPESPSAPPGAADAATREA